MHPETSIDIDVQLEFNDYLKANSWFLWRKFKWLIVLLLIAAVVYPLIVVVRYSSGVTVNYAWAYFVPWALLLVLLVSSYSGAKQHMASNKALHEKIHYVFSESGMDTTAASFSGTMAWQNVFAAHETGSNFLIFIARNMMYIIPKRCFQSAEQIDAFKRLLRAELGNKAKWK